MFNLSFKMKFILIVWILLQLSAIGGSNGFSVKPLKRDGTTSAPTTITTAHEKVKEESSILNQPHAVEYEDTNGG